MQADPSGLTTSVSVKGSARYLSPELLEDGAVYSREGDVWAWGCVLFEVMRLLALLRSLKDPRSRF